MNFVLGSSGRLGRALVSSFAGDEVVLVARHLYADWWRQRSAKSIAAFFERWKPLGGTVYVAAGILDPSLPFESHLQANFLLPKNVAEIATRMGMRVVSFGTILETLYDGDQGNPYIKSKKKLADYVCERAVAGEPLLHARLHTLYGGGLPAASMFLGQILDALRGNVPFRMSPGMQLREYHHVEDDVAALRLLLSREVGGCINLNHGDPVSLKALAKHIFQSFDRLDLLEVGALNAPDLENYEQKFVRPPLLSQLEFRETLSGVVNYLRWCVVRADTASKTGDLV